MLTAVVQMEIDGGPVGHDELLGICRLLFLAGLDTVTDSLTCFFVFLAQILDHRRRLVEDPDIIPMAVEEMLRYETPAPWVPRTATQDIEINGSLIKKGEQVVLLVGSADTDERAYEHEDEVDFDRPHVKHFAFGGGVHRCLGMHLARHELRIALQEWHRRIPSYHVPDGVELEWAPVMRQVMYLPLVFDEVVELSSGGRLTAGIESALDYEGVASMLLSKKSSPRYAPRRSLICHSPSTLRNCHWLFPALSTLTPGSSMAIANW